MMLNEDTVLIAHPDLGETIELSQRAHAGQVDKCGRPYYLHPLRVAMRLANCTSAERHAALLHDVVEDTSVTLEDLRKRAYSTDIMALVERQYAQFGHVNVGEVYEQSVAGATA